MRVVIDTNVIVSAVLRPASKPAQVLDLALEGRFDTVASPELIAEYREVLARPKFSFDMSLVDALVDGLEAMSEVVVPMPQSEVTSDDPKDQFVVDLAMAADALITTGNTRHFSRYPKTVTPAEFLEMLSRL